MLRNVLFPWVERLSLIGEGGVVDRPFFGTIRNPVNMMALEHGYVVELLGEVRHLTDGFEPPDDADGSVRSLYASLAQFESMQRLHIHLENNVFFPRSIEMEDRIEIVPGESR